MYCNRPDRAILSKLANDTDGCHASVKRSTSARTLAVKRSGKSSTGVDHETPRTGLNSAELMPAGPFTGARLALELKKIGTRPLRVNCERRACCSSPGLVAKMLSCGDAP